MPTPWPIKSSAKLHELGERAPMHERARAEDMIQEIRQLVKDQSTDIARLRQLSSDLQQLAAGLAASWLCPGDGRWHGR